MESINPSLNQSPHPSRHDPAVPQVVMGSGPDNRFTFDSVFAPRERQSAIYQECVAPLLAAHMDGYNATILAYGQVRVFGIWSVARGRYSVSQGTHAPFGHYGMDRRAPARRTQWGAPAISACRSRTRASSHASSTR